MDTAGDSAPAVTIPAPGLARVSWTANWDRDDIRLSYALLRDGKVVAKRRGVSEFWNRPTMQFSDSGLAPATTYRYQIRATDPDGNVALSPVTLFTTPA